MVSSVVVRVKESSFSTLIFSVLFLGTPPKKTFASLNTAERGTLSFLDFMSTMSTSPSSSFAFLFITKPPTLREFKIRSIAYLPDNVPSLYSNVRLTAGVEKIFFIPWKK